jgi:hypothetical protein
MRLSTFENTEESSSCVKTSERGDSSYLDVKAVHRGVRRSVWTEETETEQDLLHKNAIITHAHCIGLSRMFYSEEKTEVHEARCVPEEYSDSNT